MMGFVRRNKRISDASLRRENMAVRIKDIGDCSLGSEEFEVFEFEEPNPVLLYSSLDSSSWWIGLQLPSTMPWNRQVSCTFAAC